VFVLKKKNSLYSGAFALCTKGLVKSTTALNFANHFFFAKPEDTKQVKCPVSSFLFAVCNIKKYYSKKRPALADANL
jgi:hypothetical protein